MPFIVRERCGCGAGVELETEETDATQIFGADFVNNWRVTHKHVVPAQVVEAESGDAHVSVDALVESTVGFRPGRWE